jgi:hypothetical protein
VKYNTVKYDTVEYDTVKYDTLKYDTVKYDTITYQQNTLLKTCYERFSMLPSSKIRRVQMNLCIRLVPDEYGPPEYDMI